jgi:hypothetical protein
MSPEPVFIDISCRNEKVKGCLEGFLGIMDGEVPAVPACCAQGARGICQMVEDKRGTFIGGVFKAFLVDGIGGWVVQKRILSPSGGGATYTH